METRIIWISLVVLLAVVGGFYFLFPRISRRGLLFGVYVGEEASKSEVARRITHSWYVGMGLWLAASFAVAILAGVLFQSVPGSLAAVSLLPIGFLVEYLRAYRRARGLARQDAPPAAAAFIGTEESQPLVLPNLAMGFGLVGGLYAIGYAWNHYSQLPDLVPTHFGLWGQPDAWRPRSFHTVMLLPIMSLVMGVGLGGVAYLTGRAKRAIRYHDQGVSFEAQQRFRRIMANFLAIVSLLVTAMMTILSQSSIQVALKQAQALSPVMMVLTIILLVFALAGSIYIAVRYGQGGSRLEKSAEDLPLTDGLADNRLWVLGMFYVNRDDPSLFVEHRFGLGYTINLGNPKAVTLACGFFGLIIVIAIIAVLTH
jgi:uncharacterized membrane protein